jgi:hypothetical protein
MTSKILALFSALILGWGSTGLAMAAPAEKEVPVIGQSFASKEMRPGDVWKVYLKASDPGGKMKYIFATVFQPGVGFLPPSIIRIQGENQKEFSGYIYLNTAPATSSQLFNQTMTLSVTIQGKGGVFSQPVVFNLYFTPGPKGEVPAEGVFKEQDLGPIMVTLKAA